MNENRDSEVSRGQTLTLKRTKYSTMTEVHSGLRIDFYNKHTKRFVRDNQAGSAEN